MNKIYLNKKIGYSGDEYDWMEIEQKSYIKSLIAKVDNNYYELNIYTPECYKQTVINHIEAVGYHYPPKNIISISEVNKNEVIKIINLLASNKYFDNILPISIDREDLIEI